MADSRLCSIPDCGKASAKRGWCHAHYQRWQRYGDPTGGGPMYVTKTRTCVVEGCDGPRAGYGYCVAHYKRFRRHGDPLAGNRSRGEALRFLEDVVLSYEGDDCLKWPFTTGRGYGLVTVQGRQETVSRLVCQHVHGPAPSPDHEAAHSCGQGHDGCVAKRHLSWKTRAENQADRLVHGTDNRGSKHGNSRLTESDVLEMRRLKGTMLQRDIAKRFGVHFVTVSGILAGKSWSWL